jgi:ATP-binding cassette subfamily F protein 3
VIREARPMSEGDARSFLARFLFTEEEVFKRVGDLSGGERSRVALARLTLQPANVLLLDEPTNHLDIPARQVLEEVLRAYPGTILMVSHDRYFVSAVANEIWAVEDGVIRIYRGTYEEYTTLREQGRYERDEPEAPAGPARARRKDRPQKKPERAARLGPVLAWEEPIAGLATRMAEREHAVLEATERLAYPGARTLDDLVALSHEQQTQQTDLTQTTNALITALWQELRRDPLHVQESHPT